MQSTGERLLTLVMILFFTATVGFSVCISMLGFISNEKDESFADGYHRASAFREEQIRLYEEEVERLEHANKIFRRFILDEILHRETLDSAFTIMEGLTYANPDSHERP